MSYKYRLEVFITFNILSFLKKEGKERNKMGKWNGNGKEKAANKNMTLNLGSQRMNWQNAEFSGHWNYSVWFYNVIVVQSVSCVWLCDPMDCSRPGFPVLQCLPEVAQTHVHWVNDDIQPSHPLSSPSLSVLNFFQHQSLFQRAGSSH